MIKLNKDWQLWSKGETISVHTGQGKSLVASGIAIDTERPEAPVPVKISASKPKAKKKAAVKPVVKEPEKKEAPEVKIVPPDVPEMKNATDFHRTR